MLGRWARILAWVGFAGALAVAVAVALGGPGTRWGWWAFPFGFWLLRGVSLYGLLAAAVSLLAGGLALASRRRLALVVALLGLVTGVATAGVPWWLRQQALGVSPIHDITTDLDDPPVFVAVLPLRAGARNPATYGGPAVAAQQQRGYPDLRPVDLAAPPARVLAASEAVARELGWAIVAAVPAEGRLEATATTPWFGFKDDVVVRIRPRDAGSRLDIRSVSRVGTSDLGVNAARIRRFLARLPAHLPPP
jgi:uncharacterized protein (DUF1499 family)